MKTYIVLLKMYTESLNENYIFCVRSNIQIDNKSERTIPLCRLVCDVTSATLAHAQTAARRPPSQPESLDWMAALVKSQKKAIRCSPRVCIWERVAGLYRWNVWFTSSVSGESGWDLKWNQSCISPTEVLLQYYREEKVQSVRVHLNQCLLEDATFS